MQERSRQRAMPKPSDRIIQRNPPETESPHAQADRPLQSKLTALRGAKFQCGYPHASGRTQDSSAQGDKREQMAKDRAQEHTNPSKDGGSCATQRGLRRPRLPRRPLPVTTRHDARPHPSSSPRSPSRSQHVPGARLCVPISFIMGANRARHVSRSAHEKGMGMGMGMGYIVIINLL